MLKWNEKVSNTAEEDLLVRTQQQQDDDFCRALRAALYAGKESCRLGVSTQPGISCERRAATAITKMFVSLSTKCSVSEHTFLLG